jgi:hypothetical protein
MSEREYDLARALARVTLKLQREFEKEQAGLRASDRLTWPDSWAEAQDGWDTLVHHGLVDERRRPYLPEELSRPATRQQSRSTADA